MNRGGAESLIMNIYRNIDRSKVQFDFIVHQQKKGDFDEEILELGGKIYRISSLGQIGPFSYINELVNIMKLHEYIAVHSHTDYQSGFPALAAKIAGIKRRICHSHSNNWIKKDGIKDRVTLIILQSIIKYSATCYCSCSEEAARFLFGNNGLKGTTILKNGIDVRKFTDLDQGCRDSLLVELNLPQNAKIIGHVGTFSISKNQIVILEVLSKLLRVDPNIFAVLVGDGPMKEEVERKAGELGIAENLKFLGKRADIPRLMKSFDVFLFPSIYEGFGIVTIEAQCAGIPCVLSSSVPKSVDMGLGLVSYINLNDDLDVWCSEIIKSFQIKRPDSSKIVKQVSQNGYEIKNNINEWLNLYGVVSG